MVEGTPLLSVRGHTVLPRRFDSCSWRVCREIRYLVSSRCGTSVSTIDTNVRIAPSTSHGRVVKRDDACLQSTRWPFESVLAHCASVTEHGQLWRAYDVLPKGFGGSHPSSAVRSEATNELTGCEARNGAARSDCSSNPLGGSHATVAKPGQRHGP